MISQLGVQKLQKRGTDQKVPRFFVFISLLFFNTIFFPLVAKKQPKLSLADRQSEAQMADMPLPVGGALVPAVTKIDDVAPSNATCRGSILTYRVTTTRESLVQFYEEEMMRFGWNKLAQSSGDEEILIFESPSKVAIIQMRPEKSKKGWKRNKKILLTLHETSKENGTEL
jgi:hypothetical protein